MNRHFVVLSHDKGIPLKNLIKFSTIALPPVVCRRVHVLLWSVIVENTMQNVAFTFNYFYWIHVREHGQSRETGNKTKTKKHTTQYVLGKTMRKEA
jgi:hypothetical protein